MPTYTITYQPGSGRHDETISADSLHDDGAHLTFHATQLVIGRPRTVVVRRITRSSVAAITTA